ncbi:hypothetical protein ABIE61_001750 [Marinobacterium sp. MBR-111]
MAISEDPLMQPVCCAPTIMRRVEAFGISPKVRYRAVLPSPDLS